MPRVPTTENIEMMIACCRCATVFSILRDAGAMSEDLHHVKRRDINLDVETLNLSGCKFHKPRVMKVKAETFVILKRLLTDNLTDQPFPSSK